VLAWGLETDFYGSQLLIHKLVTATVTATIAATVTAAIAATVTATIVCTENLSLGVVVVKSAKDGV
jgi:hypothetical protein